MDSINADMQIAEKALKGMELCCGVFPKFWKKWVTCVSKSQNSFFVSIKFLFKACKMCLNDEIKIMIKTFQNICRVFQSYVFKKDKIFLGTTPKSSYKKLFFLLDLCKWKLSANCFETITPMIFKMQQSL